MSVRTEILALLFGDPKSAAQIADMVCIPIEDVYGHLVQLEGAGVVRVVVHPNASRQWDLVRTNREPLEVPADVSVKVAKESHCVIQRLRLDLAISGRSA